MALEAENLPAVQSQAVTGMASGVFPDLSGHGSAYRGLQGITGGFQQGGSQFQAALTQGDLPVPNLRCRTQVGGQTVLRLPQMDHRNGPGKPDRPQGNLRSGEHQGTLGEKALSPGVMPGEGTAPVSLDIPRRIGKAVFRVIDYQTPCHPVTHAEDPVTALQKWHPGEGTHNVITNGGRGTKPHVPPGTALRVPQIQMDSPRRKETPVQSGQRTPP